MPSFGDVRRDGNGDSIGTVMPSTAAAAAAVLASLLEMDADDDAVIEDSVHRLADVWEGPEAKAGIRAFLEKRPAPWQ